VCAGRRSSSICPGHRVVAATASTSCSPRLGMRSSCLPANRPRTERRERRRSSGSVRPSRQDRAHRLRAPVRVHRGISRAGGGSVAVTASLPWEAWALGGAVAFWVAGFDLFYSLFDLDVDREQGLHSVATRFGVRGAFAGARAFHVLAVVLLAAVGVGLGLGWWYWLGVAAVALLLAYEHSLVRPGDLRRLDAAFFTV